MILFSNFKIHEQELLNGIILKKCLKAFLTEPITYDLVAQIYPECESNRKLKIAKDRGLRRLREKIEKDTPLFQLLTEKADIVDKIESQRSNGLSVLQNFEVSKKEQKIEDELKITNKDKDKLLYRYNALINNVLDKAELLKDSVNDKDTAKQLTIIKALEPAISLINSYLNQEDIKKEYSVLQQLNEAEEYIGKLEVTLSNTLSNTQS